MNIYEHEFENFMTTAPFEERVIAFIRLKDPVNSENISDDSFKKEVVAQTIKAQSYGMTDESSIVMYILTAWFVGLNFDTQYTVYKKILNNDTYSSLEKGQALGNFTMKLFSELSAHQE